MYYRGRPFKIAFSDWSGLFSVEIYVSSHDDPRRGTIVFRPSVLWHFSTRVTVCLTGFKLNPTVTDTESGVLGLRVPMMYFRGLLWPWSCLGIGPVGRDISLLVWVTNTWTVTCLVVYIPNFIQNEYCLSLMNSCHRCLHLVRPFRTSHPADHRVDLLVELLTPHGGFRISDRDWVWLWYSVTTQMHSTDKAEEHRYQAVNMLTSGWLHFEAPYTSTWSPHTLVV